MDPKAFVYVAMSGEQVRGAPGAVWVDSANSIAKYLKLEEIQPEKLRDDFQDMIEEDENTHYFILSKQDDNVHIFKYPRKQAMIDFQNGTLQIKES